MASTVQSQNLKQLNYRPPQVSQTPPPPPLLFPYPSICDQILNSGGARALLPTLEQVFGVTFPESQFHA